MTIWAISDLHLFHANMLRSGKIGSRPFDTVEEMHERIIEGWNSVVKTNDKVYMLGDLTLMRPVKDETRTLQEMAEVRKVTDRLYGKKRLLLGNHDHYSVFDYVQWFGFEKVLAYRVLAGMVFSHIPVHPSQFARFKANVHGHTHEKHISSVGLSTQSMDPRYVNVCVEPLDYVPISLEQIQQGL